MNTKKLWPWVAVGGGVLVIGVAVWLLNRDVPLDLGPLTPGPTTSTPEVVGREGVIEVSAPAAGATVGSPLVITGRARGTWFFEGSFPVKIVDKGGSLVTTTHATAQGDWMTEGWVEFTATVPFNVVTTTPAMIVLEKDNPSGLPEHDDSISFPVTLQPSAPARTVKLFYYSSSLDTDKGGNAQCSEAGLSPVTRYIPITQTPIQDAIALLLQGQLSAAERAQGLETEFPLPGVVLRGAALNNGVLTLEFSDPQLKTSGGSCRVSILKYQIEATAKQFPEVKQVEFRPAELFQP